MLRRAMLAALLLTGCRASNAAQVKDEALTPDPAAAAPAADAAGPKFCTAHRGNGNLIMAHFAALARLVEHYGLVDGLAGGSSGSITIFFYESIYANPLVHACNGAACSAEESAARAALLLKSMQGYVALLTSTDEAVAFQQLAPILAKAKAQGIDKLILEDAEKGRVALLALLTSKDLKDIVNKEVITLLTTSGHPQYHAKDIWKGLSSFGSWKAEDPTIFVRPGLVDFKALARKIGRVGNFYAGYGPYDGPAAEAWMNACATPGRGKNWPALAALPAGGTTCGAAFDAMAKTYRTSLIAAEGQTPSRIDDPIGKYLPALVMTALLEGEDAAGRFAAARKQYLAAEPLTFKMDFDLVKIGYWGRDEDLERVRKNERGYTDMKTQKFVALGPKTWAEILGYSPAEPGLTRFQEMSPTRVSAGGWPDLHPTLALKNLGCENVAYVTRRGEESGFITGIAQLLGMTPAQHDQYFPLDRAEGQGPSAIVKSLEEADGVWCTNWNAYDTPQVSALSEHSYNTPFEARSPFFKNAANPYPNAVDQVGFRGCTVGAPASAL